MTLSVLRQCIRLSRQLNARSHRSGSFLSEWVAFNYPHVQVYATTVFLNCKFLLLFYVFTRGSNFNANFVTPRIMFIG